MMNLSSIPDDQLISMLQNHPMVGGGGNIGAGLDAFVRGMKPSEHPIDNALNYAAQGFAQTGNGLLGLATDAAGGVGMLTPEQTTNTKALIAQANKNIPNMFPTKPGIEGLVGTAVGNAVPAFAGMTGAGPVSAGAISGGISGALNTPPEADISDKAMNTGIGAGAGALTGKVLSSILGPSKSYLTDEEQRLADVMKENNISLTPAQATGNKSYKLMESTFNNLPITASVQDQVSDDQASAFTKAILEKAGVSSESATPDIISKGYHNSGGLIGDITEKYSMPVDNQFIGDIIKVQQQYGDVIAPNERPQFNEWVDKLTDPKQTSLAGSAYQDTRSNLGRIAQSAWQRDPNFARAVDGLQEAMDNSISRAMPPEDASALQQARGFYGNMKTVMRAMNSGSEAALSGNIPPSRLGQALRTGNSTGYVTGGGELNDLSRAGEAFLKPSMGDSGTAGRSKMAELMQGKWGPVLGAGGAGMAAGGPAGALIAGGTTVGLPAAIQQVYNRMPGYMVNGVPGLNTPMALKIAAMLAGNKEGSLVNTNQ